jgi:peroxiredoxin
MRKILLIIIGIAGVLVAFWLYKSYKTVPSLPAYDHVLVNEEDERINISHYKGKFVLITYFQTWCGSCIHELPSIETLQTIIGKDKLEVFVVSDEDAGKIQRFKRFAPDLNFYRTDQPLNDLGIRIFPTTYLLNTKGEVIMSKLDAYDWSSPDVINAIKQPEK